jgi:hypothetical protein
MVSLDKSPSARVGQVYGRISYSPSLSHCPQVGRSREQRSLRLRHPWQDGAPESVADAAWPSADESMTSNDGPMQD